MGTRGVSWRRLGAVQGQEYERKEYVKGNENENPSIRIDDVRFTSSSCEAKASGLLGYVECTANDTLRLDGITLRRTVDGRVVLSFPARLDGVGRKRPYIRPLDDRARRDVEAQVLRALGFAVES